MKLRALVVGTIAIRLHLSNITPLTKTPYRGTGHLAVLWGSVHMTSLTASVSCKRIALGGVHGMRNAPYSVLTSIYHGSFSVAT